MRAYLLSRKGVAEQKREFRADFFKPMGKLQAPMIQADGVYVSDNE